MDYDHSDQDHSQGASYEAMSQQIKNRLRRIEGQVRGVERMVGDGRYCIDVLTQLSAISESLRRVTLMVSQSHAKGCITRFVEEGHGDEAIEELVTLLFKFSR